MIKTELDEIADFVISYSDGLYNHTDYEHISRYALIHREFGTLMVVKDNNNIIAVCRWNMISNSHAKVLDFIVHPDYRHKKLARYMLLRAKRDIPLLESITFYRKKYSMRTSTYLISRWIKEKTNGRKS